MKLSLKCLRKKFCSASRLPLKSTPTQVFTPPTSGLNAEHNFDDKSRENLKDKQRRVAGTWAHSDIKMMKNYARTLSPFIGLQHKSYTSTYGARANLLPSPPLLSCKGFFPSWHVCGGIGFVRRFRDLEHVLTLNIPQPIDEPFAVISRFLFWLKIQTGEQWTERIVEWSLEEKRKKFAREFTVCRRFCFENNIKIKQFTCTPLGRKKKSFQPLWWWITRNCKKWLLRVVRTRSSGPLREIHSRCLCWNSSL